MAQNKKSKIINFFSDGLSVDETRVSVLMICLLGALTFGGYIYFVTGAISTVWADLITTLIIAVAGINALSTVMEGKQKINDNLSNLLQNKNDKEQQQNNDFLNNPSKHIDKK
nr:MAG TPA: hypothetical protein [Caudoviricetes sp.]